MVNLEAHIVTGHKFHSILQKGFWMLKQNKVNWKSFALILGHRVIKVGEKVKHLA